jgi:hypothetical protein
VLDEFAAPVSWLWGHTRAGVTRLLRWAKAMAQFSA